MNPAWIAPNIFWEMYLASINSASISLYSNPALGHRSAIGMRKKMSSFMCSKATSHDEGDHLLTPGMCAGVKAGNGNGHCLKNLTDRSVTYLEVGTRSASETAWYSDIDMKVSVVDRVSKYTKKDGTPY
jgi:hypothetical protein